MFIKSNKANNIKSHNVMAYHTRYLAMAVIYNLTNIGVITCVVFTYISAIQKQYEWKKLGFNHYF